MEVCLNGTELSVFEDGTIFRMNKAGVYIKVPANDNCQGYNRIQCKYKKYRRHRIIGWCYLGLDIDDTTKLIDHKDGNKLNNAVSNLRIVNSSQNSMNRLGVSGYSMIRPGKWRARLKLNYKSYHLGVYNSEEDARLAYLSAKLMYHIIESDNSLENISKKIENQKITDIKGNLVI
tara:strand:+ start:720 stop:1247 length:528 start_codon:yes stop_codon:yes gene_type:complete